MNILLLYLLLLKATITAFSGPTSLPMIRAELVIQRHVITDEQLNTAIVVGRTTPGPNGIYVVCVGYYAAGIPGALAGWGAMATPALLVIPLLQILGKRADHPAIRRVLQSVILAGVGLVLSSLISLAQSSAAGAIPAILAFTSFLLLAFTRVSTGLVALGAAIVLLICNY